MTRFRLSVFRTSFAVRFLLTLLVPALTTLATAAESEPSLETDLLRLSFDRVTGQLTEFTDKQNGHAFVDFRKGDDFWSLQLRSPSEASTITLGAAGTFAFEPQEDNEPSLELTWGDFGIEEAPQFQVVARVSVAPKKSTAYWGIAVENTGNLTLDSLHFPRIPGIAAQQNERLAAPLWMGQLAKEPRVFLCKAEKPGRIEWAYPGRLSLQCFALYSEAGPGIFLSADDTAAFVKRFCVFGAPENRLGIEVVHIPERTPESQEHYEPAYRVVLGTFEGDWFTAAERYREWALGRPWARKARLRANAVEDWVTETALWIWNRGRSEQVLTPALAFKERTGLPVSVFWHWWHGCAYDIGFPEYLPPREGTDRFRDAVKNVRDAGINAMVYMNQRLWGMTTESWEKESAARYAVKGPDGKIHPETYNKFKPAPCAAMCMGTSFWRDKYAGLAEEVVLDLGVSAIYMDQACLSLACYDPTHGHPIGGGTYWVNGFRMLETDIRKRCPNVVLAGEGCGEAWLPHLDLMLSLQVSMERYAQPGVWEPIPFFHAVYHGYGIFFGNYSSLTMPPYDELWPPEFAPKEPLKLLDTTFSQQFRLEQARAFVWGQQLTIANFLPAHFEERRAEVAYLIQLAKLRMRGLKYLLHGTMLRPPVVGLPDEEIDVSRLSIYAGQKDALKQYRKAFPLVMASAWLAEDGDVAVVLANVSDDPQAISLDLPA
ncbi:MAG: DUF6259 domain-containing protein, partial [Candidatus Hydrogenedentes bacterium]|nr:DUF6259 domain-containing protein [Candidatus Hydrogenedentota bacterium]